MRLQKIKAWFQFLKTKLFSEEVLEGKDKRFLFYFFSISFCILFYTVSILAGKNPYSLLVYDSLVDPPSFDKRSSILLYASDSENKIFPIKRKILQYPGDKRKNLEKLIAEVSRSAYDDSGEFSGVSIRRFPDLETAIIAIWIREGGSNLILDFRENTLKIETEKLKVRLEDQRKFASSEFETEESTPEVKDVQKEVRLKKYKYAILATYFQALEKTIFDNYPEIRKIEYRLNGVKKNLDGLEYELIGEKTRESILK